VLASHAVVFSGTISFTLFLLATYLINYVSCQVIIKVQDWCNLDYSEGAITKNWKVKQELKLKSKKTEVLKSYLKPRDFP